MLNLIFHSFFYLIFLQNTLQKKMNKKSFSLLTRNQKKCYNTRASPEWGLSHKIDSVYHKQHAKVNGTKKGKTNMVIMKQSLRSNSRKCYGVYVFVDGDLQFRFADFNFHRAKEFYDRMCVDNAFIFEMSVDLLPDRYRDYIAA